jgi:PAS domain S-box-containing protein
MAQDEWAEQGRAVNLGISRKVVILALALLACHVLVLALHRALLSNLLELALAAVAAAAAYQTAQRARGFARRFWRLAALDGHRDLAGGDHPRCGHHLGLCLAPLLTRSRLVRSLFGRVAVFLLVFSVGDLIYFHVQIFGDMPDASWYELLWTVPRTLLILLAASWTPPAETVPEPGKIAAEPLLLAQFAHIALPLVVLITAAQAQRQQLAVAVVAVLASFGCSSARLVLGQRAQQQLRLRQEQTAESLRAAEEKYRNIFENAVNGIFQVTPEGKYTAANPAFVRMLGYDSTEEFLRSRTYNAKENYADPAVKGQFQDLLRRDGELQSFPCATRSQRQRHRHGCRNPGQNLRSLLHHKGGGPQHWARTCVVYGIVKQSKGYVSVYSEVGHGSTFRIYLPVDERAAKPQAAFTARPLSARGTETILLVEDDPAVRGLANSILHDKGYDVLAPQPRKPNRSAHGTPARFTCC